MHDAMELNTTRSKSLHMNSLEKFYQYQAILINEQNTGEYNPSMKWYVKYSCNTETGSANRFSLECFVTVYTPLLNISWVHTDYIIQYTFYISSVIVKTKLIWILYH